MRASQRLDEIMEGLIGDSPELRGFVIEECATMLGRHIKALDIEAQAAAYRAVLRKLAEPDSEDSPSEQIRRIWGGDL